MLRFLSFLLLRFFGALCVDVAIELGLLGFIDMGLVWGGLMVMDASTRGVIWDVVVIWLECA